MEGSQWLRVMAMSVLQRMYAGCITSEQASSPMCHAYSGMPWQSQGWNQCNSNCSSPDIIMYISTNLHLACTYMYLPVSLATCIRLIISCTSFTRVLARVQLKQAGISFQTSVLIDWGSGTIMIAVKK